MIGCTVWAPLKIPLLLEGSRLPPTYCSVLTDDFVFKQFVKI